MNFPATPVSKDEVRERFNMMVKSRHPDKGGDRDSFEQLLQARDQAYAELGGA